MLPTLALTLGLFAAFAFVLPYIGFSLACFLFLAALLWVLSARPWWKAMAVACHSDQLPPGFRDLRRTCPFAKGCLKGYSASDTTANGRGAMRVGFIGLAPCVPAWRPTCRRPATRWWSVSLTPAPQLAGRRAVGRQLAKAVASRSCCCRLQGPAVEGVALGKDGLVEGMQPGALFDLTTNSPTLRARDRRRSSPRGRSSARCARERRKAHPDGRAHRCGSAATRPYSTRKCESMLDGFSDAARYIVRSARARSPSSCTTARVMPSRRRSPRCSRSASRAASSRWPVGGRAQRRQWPPARLRPLRAASVTANSMPQALPSSSRRKDMRLATNSPRAQCRRSPTSPWR